jgi:hypothetical protein
MAHELIITSYHWVIANGLKAAVTDTWFDEQNPICTLCLYWHPKDFFLHARFFHLLERQLIVVHGHTLNGFDHLL